MRTRPYATQARSGESKELVASEKIFSGYEIVNAALVCEYCVMGYLVYGATNEFEIDDRTLAHLKVTVSMKLRRQESFFISWVNPVEKGSGRISLWVSPSIPLIFRFSGSKSPEMNTTWLEVLNELSHTPRGVVLTSEAEAEAYAANQQAK